MPIYEFECNRCGNVFDQFFHTADFKTAPNCSKCDSPDTQKQLSTFGVGHIFPAVGVKSSNHAAGSMPNRTRRPVYKRIKSNKKSA